MDSAIHSAVCSWSALVLPAIFLLACQLVSLLEVFYCSPSNIDGESQGSNSNLSHRPDAYGGRTEGEPKGEAGWVPETILVRITHPGGSDEGWEEADYPRFISHRKLFDAPNENLCCQDLCLRAAVIMGILHKLDGPPGQGREYWCPEQNALD